jgi:hypothetical protein
MARRAEFGLESSEVYVDSLENALSVDRTTFGFPVTELERQRLVQIDALTQAASAVQKSVIGLLGSRFSGTSVDWSTGELDYRVVGGGTEAELAAIRGLLPPTAVVELLPATYGLEELQSIQNRVIGDFSSEPVAGGIAVNSSLVDIDANRIRVSIVPDVIASRQYLVEHYGDVFAFTGPPGGLPEDDRLTAYPHVRGGLGIENYDNVYYCSSSISATNGTSYYVLTAGHCGNLQRHFIEGALGHGPTPVSIGVVLGNAYTASGTTNCDCARVGSISAAQATNIDYITPTTGQYYDDWVRSASYWVLNEMACFSGAGQAWAGTDYSQPRICTQVRGWNAQLTYGGHTVTGLVYTPHVTQGGDSGGSWGANGYVWFGIHAGSDTNNTYSYFSPAYNVTATLGVTPMTYTP